MNLYEILGVKPDASSEEIKKAYRSKAQQLHPDKQNGSSEEFQKVQRAYEVLRDLERRKLYDTQGSVEREQTLEAKALHNLAELFMGIVNSVDHKQVNIVEQMREHLNNRLLDIKAENFTVGQMLGKYKDMIKRFKTTEKENFFVMMLNAACEEEKLKGRQLKEAKELFKKMLEILNNFTYETDLPKTSLNSKSDFFKCYTSGQMFTILQKGFMAPPTF